MTDAADFDLLMEAVTPVEAEMIKGLLEEAGIPCLVHTADFDMVDSSALYCAVAESFSITLLRLKVPGFWRGGNSLKLCSHRATYVWAGPSA